MNHKLITDHIRNKIKKNYLKSDNQRWEVPCLIKCNSNSRFLLPFYSDFWRAMEYIDHTLSFNILEDNKRQLKWHDILQPNYSQLKFRLPYYGNETNEKYYKIRNRM